MPALPQTLPAAFQSTAAEAEKAQNTPPPLCIEAAWSAENRSDAQRLEYRIKALSRAEKEALICGCAPEALDLSAYRRLSVNGDAPSA